MTPGFFAELKRRHVDRVAIAYAVGAWLIAQVAALLAEAFDLPSWVLRATIIALVLGLPIAIIVSWAYELTPGGLKRDEEVAPTQASRRRWGRKLDFAIIGLLVVALALSLVTRRSGEQGATELDKSVAVLPFLNLSGDAQKEYLSEGISDSLIHALVQASELKVIARTSSFQFKGREIDVREIGQKLGVGAVLEGSVQESGDQLRVIAQLINTHDGTHYWSKTFDRPTTDIFAIQDEIAGEVLAALKVSLLGGQAARVADSGTTNLEAYDEFLQARSLFLRRASIGEAVQRYEHALALDPKFVLAWVGLADALLVWPAYDGKVDGAVTEPRAKDALARALVLDPNCGEAYAVQAAIEDDAGRPEATEAAIRKSIELAPGYAHAYYRYHEFLRNWGRFAEAEKMIRLAIERDPLSALNYSSLAYLQILQHRPKDMIASLHRALAIDRGLPLTYQLIGAYKAMELGHVDEGARWMRKAQELDPESPRFVVYAFDLLLGFDPDSAEQLIDSAEKRWPSWPRDVARARLLAARGDLTGAAAIARRVLAENPGNLQALEFVVADDRRQHRVTANLEPAMGAATSFDAGRQFIDVDELTEMCRLALILRTVGDQRAEPLIAKISSVIARPVTLMSEQGWVAVQLYVLQHDVPRATAELRRLIDSGLRWGWQDLRGPLIAPLVADPAFQAQIERLVADAARQRASLRAKPTLTDADIKAELRQ